NPDRLLAAALKLRRYNPDVIDINMGCSAKTVSGRGAGAGLLREPEKIAEIFQKLTRELDIPVTGKIRLGWSQETRNYLEVAKIIADNGGQMIAVHGRTKEQSYGGVADWGPIGEVKRSVSIPVIGNGDVRTPTNIQAMFSQTGCDGVMIARAAIGNPWIFSGRAREEISSAEVRETMLAHLESNLSFYGPEGGLILFRKFAIRYISPYPLEKPERQRLLTSSQPKEFVDLLDQILERAPQSIG
ncbi:MAG TPA: tRNA-dihydrouridine synthase, partial [Anaerolineaceae bacterium]|nr:tRNA-dihydrouridine synthase [Anaerolineaceae bacterium]